jgi:hypothetical protein
MRIAFVTGSWTGFWDERALIARRVAAALCFSGEVDVLLPQSSPEPRVERQGALSVHHFPGTPEDAHRREILLQEILGFDEEHSPSCSCGSLHGSEIARETPWILQQELVRARGGESPRLLEHLAGGAYDCVVFVDSQMAATALGARAVAANTRVVLLPMARNEPTFHLPIYDSSFERAERILVTSETERGLIQGRVSGPSRVRPIGFALRTDPLAAATEPFGFDGQRFLVALGDWTSAAAREDFAAAADTLHRDFGDLLIRAFGPGVEALQGLPGVRVSQARTRVDLWRWMYRALAVVDWQHGRVLGCDVLEAMLNGTAVIVHELAGAAREHAERGDGGLWYRTRSELSACIRALASDGVARRLGQQGRAYAVERYGDSNAFVAAVVGALAD